MKKINLICLLVFLLAVNTVNAELYNRGIDSLGNRLIYDSDLNITWYDYTNTPPPQNGDTWQNQVDWADTLSVTFGSKTYNDWRLPTTPDGIYIWGFDDTATQGFNITTSEMGHLFYTELGNAGFKDTSGNLTGCDVPSPYCLTNTGDFQNLQPNNYYVSGTEWAANPYYDNIVWIFNFGWGRQDGGSKDTSYLAIAVMDGDVATFPEPTIDNILAFFDESVDLGTLYGRGTGWLANLRLRIMRKLIEINSEFIAQDRLNIACFVLQRVHELCDGELLPREDLVTGSATVELASMIEELMDYIGCE